MVYKAKSDRAQQARRNLHRADTWEREHDGQLVSAAWLVERLVKIGARLEVEPTEHEVFTTPVGGAINTGVSSYIRVA